MNKQPRFASSPDNNEATEKVIDAINEKNNRLNNKILEVGEKQGIWNEWLVDLKGCLTKQTRVDFYFKDKDDAKNKPK